MKEEISINFFDEEKLNKLRDIFEKYQIESITMDKKIKDDSKYIIEYNEKPPIILNKKFTFKIKLLRNKYYRQLLNLLYIKKDINKKIDECNSFIELYNKYGAIIGMRTDAPYYLDEIDLFNYTDILKMCLINYIGTHNFDNIFELTKDEMLMLKDYKCLNNNSEYIIRLLGVFVPKEKKEKIIKILEPRIYGSKLDEMKKCKNFIIICPEIIQEFCVKYFEKFKDCGINDIFELYTIIFNLVLVHEIGHGVFEYFFYFGNDETKANYFASITFEGTFDEIIKVKTNNIQKGEYANPVLITDGKGIEEIEKNIYNIVK